MESANPPSTSQPRPDDERGILLAPTPRGGVVSKGGNPIRILLVILLINYILMIDYMVKVFSGVKVHSSMVHH